MVTPSYFTDNGFEFIGLLDGKTPMSFKRHPQREQAAGFPGSKRPEWVLHESRDTNCGLRLRSTPNAAGDSINLLDIDLDTREARELANTLMPRTVMVLSDGRISHLLYCVAEKPANLLKKQPAAIEGLTAAGNHADKPAAAPFEIKYGPNRYAVVPPSVNSEGTHLEWRGDVPAELSESEARRSTTLLAALCTVAAGWPHGEGAHESHLQLGAVLASYCSDMSIDDIGDVADAIDKLRPRSAGTDKHDSRRAAMDSATKQRAGEEVRYRDIPRKALNMLRAASDGTGQKLSNYTTVRSRAIDASDESCGALYDTLCGALDAERIDHIGDAYRITYVDTAVAPRPVNKYVMDPHLLTIGVRDASLTLLDVALSRRRQLYIGSGVFPPPHACPPRVYNTWDDYRIPAIEAPDDETRVVVDWYRELADDVIGFERRVYDESTQSIKTVKGDGFLWRLLAWKAQNPGLHSRGIFVLAGPGGCGKTKLVDIYCRLFPPHTTRPAARFNENVRFTEYADRLVVVFSELPFPTHMSVVPEQIKRLTDTMIDWERKGIDAENIRNMALYGATTNDGDTISDAIMAQRRVILFRCHPDVRPASWFAPLDLIEGPDPKYLSAIQFALLDSQGEEYDASGNSADLKALHEAQQEDLRYGTT